MEFRFRAGEKRHPSSSSSSSYPSTAIGYFAEQALRAGLVRIGGEVGQPMTAVESLKREIRKELIREEILREMAERRILEEEVIRELEIEWFMAMRRVQEERSGEPITWRLTPLGPELRAGDEFGLGLVTRAPFIGFDERLLHPMRSNSREENNLPLSAQRRGMESIESSTLEQVEPSEQRLSGTKRKPVANAGPGKLPKRQKEWSCALCQVSVTCEEGLNDHLQGKKHKAKLAKLQVSKAGAENNGVTALKPKTAVATKEEGASTNDMRTLKMQVDGQMHEVLQMKKFLLCERCDVRCNSNLAMAAHLSGKKHNSWIGESKKDDSSKERVEKDLTTEAAKKDGIEKEEKDAVKEGEKQSTELDGMEAAAGEATEGSG